jgi:hypothetical protein
MSDFNISLTEELMLTKWGSIYHHGITPKAASKTLQLLFDKKEKLLSDTSQDFHWQTMKETSTRLNRIRVDSPKKAIVAYKTGS